MAFTWVSLKTPTVIQSMNFKSSQSANLKKMSLLDDLMTKLVLWINHTVYRKHSPALEVKITWICLPAGGNSSGCKKKSNSISFIC